MLPHSASQGWLQPVSGPIHAEQQIFISVAAYRDPNLVATISDCLAKASEPDRLRFVICWQHGPEEQLPEWMRAPQFQILDVDWRESRGGCWARAAIMKQWAGEDWFLQIDSHHRFAQDWDTILVGQAALADSPKPLLSAPAPAFTIGEPPPAAMPLRAEFTGFRADGIPDIRVGVMEPDGRRTPVRARSVCGHLLFAPGSFARDVPYDPEMYFSWEETTIAVRAFTHGYDLFHPAAVVTWHEYTRAYRVKHWDDHTGKQDGVLPWYRLRQQAIAKVADFFANPMARPFGLGPERTFADYEDYAGVSFRHRRVQDYTRLNKEPPNPPTDPGWAERVKDHRIEIAVDIPLLPEAATKDPVLWYVGIHDSDGRELYRQDASAEDLARLLAEDRSRVRFIRQFTSEAVPTSWTVLPLSTSAGWLPPITRKIPAHDLPAWPTAGAYVCWQDQLVRYVPVASVPTPLLVPRPLRILGVVSSRRPRHQLGRRGRLRRRRLPACPALPAGGGLTSASIGLHSGCP